MGLYRYRHFRRGASPAGPANLIEEFSINAIDQHDAIRQATAYRQNNAQWRMIDFGRLDNELGEMIWHSAPR